MTESWRIAVDWLSEVGVVNKALIEESGFTLDLFMLALRDGEILINLLNCLLNKQFRALSSQGSHYAVENNITKFINEATHAFQLETDQLFTFNDLYSFTGIEKVMNTLSVISHHTIVANKGLKPFSLNKTALESEYSNLSEIANESIDDNKYEYIDQLKNTNTAEQDIYDIILNVSTAVPAEELDKFEPKNTFDYIAKELVETENNYVTGLATLVKIKEKMMIYLKETDISIIFNQIDNMYELHKNMLTRMLAELQRKELCFGPIIKKYRTNFLCYSDYCVNIEIAKAKIKDVELDLRYTEILTKTMEQLDCKQDIVAYLLLPFQRVLRYALIYERLKKNMPPNCSDEQNLIEAISILKNLSDHINQMKKDQEIINMTFILSEIISKDSISCNIPSARELGHHITDGIIKLKVNNDLKKLQKCHVFLFETRLLAFKSEDNLLYPRVCIDFIHYKILPLSSKEKNEYGWIMRFDQDGMTDQIAFKVKDRQQQENWIKSLTAVVKKRLEVNSYKTHNYQLETLPIASICSHCSLLLRGSISQGYICHVCKGTFHEECLPLAAACAFPKSQSSCRLPKASASVMVKSVGRCSSIMSFTKNFDNKWFDPSLNRQKAEEIIIKGTEGSFIVRGASVFDAEAPYVLSFMFDRIVRHMKVYFSEDAFFLCPTRKFDSMKAMIFYYQTHSIGEIVKAFPTMLRIPARGPLYSVSSSKTHSSPSDEEIGFVKGEHFKVLNEADDRLYVINSLGICGFVPKNKVQTVRH